MEIIKKYHEPKSTGMISASAEAAKKTYKKVTGKSGKVWLIPTDNDPSRIHVNDEKDKNSDGYAGRTLEFQLDTGETYEAKGPWNSNPDSLYNDTGVDLRNMHLTRGLVALERTRPKSKRFGDAFNDVIYMEEDWVVGSMDRVEKIAQQFANDLDRNVAYRVESHGAVYSAVKKPNK